MKQLRWLWGSCLLIIVTGSLFMLKMQDDTARLLSQLTFELEKSKQVMSLSTQALVYNDKLHARNMDSLRMTRRTILGMKVTSLLTEETIQMQKEGLRLLKETNRIARETVKELRRTKVYSYKLYDIARQTDEASKPLEDFTYFSYDLARKGLEIAEGSLKIVRGEAN